MKIENQVCSLELSKRLKELGVKQDSSFYWLKQFKDDDYFIYSIDHNYHHSTNIKTFINDFTDIYSAFTVAELGEMLPICCFSWKVNVSPNWLCSADEPSVQDSIKADKEADARAKMLIHLIENDLIKINTYNNCFLYHII